MRAYKNPHVTLLVNAYVQNQAELFVGPSDIHGICVCLCKRKYFQAMKISERNHNFNILCESESRI